MIPGSGEIARSENDLLYGGPSAMLRRPWCCGEDAHDHRHAHDEQPPSAAHQTGPGWKPRGSLLAPDLPVSRHAKWSQPPVLPAHVDIQPAPTCTCPCL